MDFPDCSRRIDDLVVPAKPVADSVIGFGVLFVYDGRTQRVELDLLYDLVVNWTADLLWL